jgi:hypothetical protein
VTELEQAEVESEQLRERKQAERRAFLQAQPQIEVTLSDVLGVPLPSLRQAVRQLEDVCARITDDSGRLHVSLPERVSGPRFVDGMNEQVRRAELYRACRVVYAAETLVLAALRTKSKRPLSERVPDGAVLPSGDVSR